MAAFLPAATLESFRASLGLSYTQAGAVLAAIAPGALAGAGFAAAADHRSRRVIAAGGAFGFAAALALFAAGGSFPVLVAAGFALGAASTAMVDGAEVALVDLAGDDLRPCLARANLLGTVGDLAGPALVAAVALAGLSWRVAFAIAAVLLALYGAVLAASPLPGPRAEVPDPATDPHPGSAASPPRPLAAVARDRSVWVVGVLSLLMGPLDETLLGFLVALLERDRRVSPGLAMAVAFVGVGGGLVAYTVLARRSAAVADGRLLLASAVAMTAGALLLAAVPVVPATGVVAVAAGAAFVVSVGLNLGWLALQHRSLTLRPGQVGATKAVILGVEFGGFWIPAAIGIVADRAGLGAAMWTFVLMGGLVAALAWTSARATS